MQNINAALQLKEAWNRHLDNYQQLLNMYKDQGYKIKRNDKTGEHIVEKQDNNAFNDIFGDIFNGGRV